MPTWDRLAVSRAAARLRLATDPRRRRQGVGTRLGSGPGASLEFHDHRPYEPGDDLRHLDWGVYARSDQLVLRRQRQEVSPQLDLLVDLSASVGLTPAKASLVAALTALVAELASDEGLKPHLWCFTDAPRRLPGAWREALTTQPPSGTAGFDATAPRLRPGSERLLIGDGLCPAGGASVVRRLGADAGRITLIQVLTRDEVDPPALGAGRLEDLEGGFRDLVVDPRTITAYRDRLRSHQDEWRRALHARGAGLVTCIAEEGFDTAVKALLVAGVVE